MKRGGVLKNTYYKEADDIANNCLRRWTLEAIHCYLRNSNCTVCPIAEVIETQCKMGIVVNLLLNKFGKPTEKIYRRLLLEEERRFETR